MTTLPPPTLRLRIDSDALAHNWRALDTLSGSARAGAAVKANCYGLGVESCLPVLRDRGRVLGLGGGDARRGLIRRLRCDAPCRGRLLAERRLARVQLRA